SLRSCRLRLVIGQQASQQDVSIDRNHAALLFALGVLRFFCRESCKDSSSENRRSAFRCLSTPALAPTRFLMMVIRPSCSTKSRSSPGCTPSLSHSSLGTVICRLALRMDMIMTSLQFQTG